MEAESSGANGSAGGPQEGWLLIRVNVPELNVQKNLQFPKDQLVWDVKQQCLAALPKELKESFNYGLFCPPVNGKAGKFLDEERRLGDYPFNGPVGYLELKYKRRVYKMLKLDEKQLKSIHTRANLRRFLDYVTHGQVEKITKMCAKGLDPNFHCHETGETPLSIATSIKKPSKILIALVNGGALLDYRTRDGSTAMHRAVERDSLEGVKTLLELGASPNYKDGKGLTPLYLSVTNKTDPLICETLLHDHGIIGAQDLQGWQEVHQACRNGLVQHLEHLVAYGADLEARNASGNTPLHVCAVNGQRAAARLLLFRGASKDALNFAGQTPYQVAVIAGDLELAESINAYKSEDVVLYRGPPCYNPRRRSGIVLGSSGSWSSGTPGDRSSMASTLTRIPCELEAMLRNVNGPPSPCPYDHSFSSASSSMSEGSHPEDNASIVTDKSLGDASDIISDSSGVGTSNSDTTTCSISLPGTTVVCLENYDSGLSGHLRICQGDIIEVTGASDCGLLEGQVRGTNSSGLFPPRCVHEVRLRHAGAVPVLPVLPSAYNSTTISPRVAGRREAATKNYSATAPRLKKTNNLMESRTVVLHRGRRGFGFVLRGAKATSPLMELQPSERCPGLQYLDDVDKGGAADMAGLQKGDFLIAINGEDVSTASHEKVVELIRSSGALVSMTVVSSWNPLASNMNTSLGGVPPSRSVASLVSQGAGAPRPFATLPRKAGTGGIGSGGRSPAPAPPRRDPRTTLSVGRARAKSMVAGLENGGEKDDNCEQLSTTKSSSAESIQHQAALGGSVGAVNSVMSQSTDSNTPPSARTASIRARPASSRITAAELEELFQRQQGHNKGSAMMTTSAFQEGCINSPPFSPAKSQHTRVYASVAEMKRSKGKSWARALRQKSSGELRRQFHSTPDLAVTPTQGSLPFIPSLAYQRHKYRSQEDMHGTSLYLASLPPPLHPPPPVPSATEGAIVAVVSSAERSSTILSASSAVSQPPMSSFRPADSAKLYAAPQAATPVAYRTKAEGRPPVRKTQSLRVNSAVNTHPPRQMSVGDSSPINSSQASPQPQYAQPFKSCRNNAYLPRQNSCSGPPPIPEPDYSMSESEDETGNNPKRDMPDLVNNIPQNLAETSANSNASGSSSGSGSMHHSFSVEEIQKIKTQLKSSKSYPNDFALQEGKQNDRHDDGDNSSSGVSSDQELTIQQENMDKIYNNKSLSEAAQGKVFKQLQPVRAKEKVSFSSNVTVKSSNNVITTEPVQLHSSSESISSGGVQANNGLEVTHIANSRYRTVSTPSGNINVVNAALPPSGTLQRHNSLTRKQAAGYMLKREPRSGQSAAERLGVNVAKSPLAKKNVNDSDGQRGGALTRNAVSLVQLPPPPEESGSTFVSSEFDLDPCTGASVAADVPPLAPPPQFSDKVRIVGAVPKQGNRA